MDDQEFLARREAAMLKLEGATTIIDGFVNGPAGSSVETESGLIPTLATMRDQSNQLAAQISQAMADIATHIEELPVEDIPV